MKQIRIVKSDDKVLPVLYEEGWELITISDGKMYLHKEEKKQKSKSLVVKTETSTLNFLLSCRERSEKSTEWGKNNGITEDTLYEFADYWLEKSEGGIKYRFEMEKVFDVRRRLSTWINKPFNNKKEEPKKVYSY